MRRRPWPIVILAVLHFFAGLFNVLLHALVSPLPFTMQLQQYALPGYRGSLLFYVLAPMIAGVAIYICKKWSFWLYLAMMILIAISSLEAVQSLGASYASARFAFYMIVDIVVVVYFFLPAVRQIYFDPRLRWWENSPRYRTSHITVQFSLDGETYGLPGTAISHSHQSRMGFGFKFDESSAIEKTAKKLTKKFAAEGRLMGDRRHQPEDRFSTWLKNLLRRGKGIVPEARARK